MQEQTLAIIKPDAVKAKNAGKIIDMIETAGFEIVEMKKFQLSKELAETFYDIHREKPFFSEVIDFMTSGPVIVMKLVKENAIEDWRNLMGPTDSTKAESDTIRGKFGTDVGVNAVHGSDAQETAARELDIFFG